MYKVQGTERESGSCISCYENWPLCHYIYIYVCVYLAYISSIFTRSAQKVYSHVLWQIDIYWRYNIQETLYIGQWCLSPLLSWHVGISQLPSAVLSYFQTSESHHWSEISSLSKMILVLGKARSLRMSNMGHRGD